MTASPYIRWGCARCGYWTPPTNMGTPYKVCPNCGGPWQANAPLKQQQLPHERRETKR